MFTKKAKDLMIPIEMYPTIDQNATLLDAMLAIKKAQEDAPQGLPPYRAVLVLDENKKIIGKIGHFAFLKAFEPRYQDLLDVEKLSRINLSPQLIETIFEKFSLWQDLPFEPCEQASRVKVTEIMQPINERVEEDETISHAIHKLLMWQCLSVLVTKGDAVVGILRISEIFNALVDYISRECNKKKSTEQFK